MPADHPGAPTPRHQIRAEVSRARAARSADQQRADDRARDARTLALLDTLLPTDRTPVVACYLSRPGEPGTEALLEALRGRVRLLVPKLGRASGDASGPQPDWAWLGEISALEEGLFGIPSPDGEALGAQALAQADVVIAAGLAAGPDGNRIGTGGGWFDRALLHRSPDVPVLVLLNDDEVRPCPAEPHDHPVDWLVTPTRTIRCETTATG